ncbi:MAG: CBS domain-containing protein [Candidatus Kariarchaeaceae archaeon]|jgi:CBS domain-containing protein
MFVSDVEIEDEYVVVKASDTIYDVAQAISKAGIPDAVVLDEDETVLGALDDFDIVSKVLAVDKDHKTITAKDILYAPPPVKQTTSLKDAHEIMQELDATMLPVVDDEKKLLGVVTIMDVLEGLAKEYENLNFWGKLKKAFTF